MSKLRVLMLGAFDPNYARNYVIINGLRREGVEVDVHMFPGRMRSFRRAIEVVRHFHRRKQVDLVLIPMSNQLTAPIYWLLGKLMNQPVLLDYFLGITDTREGRKVAGRGLKDLLFLWIDRFNVTRIPSITDTAAHRQAFIDLLGVPIRDMGVVPVGVKDEIFQPLPVPDDKEKLIVQFVGNFLPVSGCDVIVRAAVLLTDHASIRFQMIGKGPTFQAVVELARELNLSNVEFLGYMGHPTVLEHMVNSSILLGIFGDYYKSSYVVPNKVYEGLALGRPMITANSPALHEFFEPDKHLITVSPGDPQALANAILKLAESPNERLRLGKAGALQIQEAYLPQHIGKQLTELILRLTH